MANFAIKVMKVSKKNKKGNFIISRKEEVYKIIWLYKVFIVFISAEPEDPGIAAFLLTALSVLLIVMTIPFSLCFVIKVKP